MIQTLLSAETYAAVVFLLFIFATLSGAAIAVSSQVLIRSVTGLALCFLGVAGIYYFLNSPFLALMQILIYVGAICVVIIFAIMLAENDENMRRKKQCICSSIAAFAASTALTVGIVWLAMHNNWQRISCQSNNGSVEQIGKSLLTTYSMSFELISVVLLVAIIGSLVLARSGRDKL